MQRYLHLALSTIIGSALGVCLTGCATTGISQSDAAAFNGSATDFVVARFGTISAFDPDKDIPRRLPDGTVVYKAVYNNVNFSLLFRPRNELRTFCEARGGAFLQTATASLDVASPRNMPIDDRAVAGAFNDPDLTSKEKIDAAENAMRRSIGDGVAARAEKTRLHESRLGGSQSKAILKKANGQGAFGRFQCKHGSDAAWRATILPDRAFRRVDSPDHNYKGLVHIKISAPT